MSEYDVPVGERLSERDRHALVQIDRLAGRYSFREEIGDYAYGLSFATHAELMAFLREHRPSLLAKQPEPPPVAFTPQQIFGPPVRTPEQRELSEDAHALFVGRMTKEAFCAKYNVSPEAVGPNPVVLPDDRSPLTAAAEEWLAPTPPAPEPPRRGREFI